MKSAIVNSNRFRSPKDAVIYNIFKTADGYLIQAYVPDQTSSSDRAKIIKYLWSYRDEVRRAYPELSVRFNNLEHGYGLEIKPIKSCRPIDEDGDNLKRILNASFTHA